MPWLPASPMLAGLLTALSEPVSTGAVVCPWLALLCEPALVPLFSLSVELGDSSAEQAAWLKAAPRPTRSMRRAKEELIICQL